HVLAEADHLFFGEQAVPRSRREIVEAYLPYLERQLGQGVPLHRMTRHMLGLYQGLPGARAWRRHLSTQAPKRGGDIGVVEEALAFVEHGEGFAKSA
ncbi:MAG: tRNA dihydrouridine(20/20a) synthase DusA, partial [Rhodospirillaceae bacterium]|nr:tRNA dihydrouridine(20/20a) synthase DusA [Rhodospirillaceae bacterium]